MFFFQNIDPASAQTPAPKCMGNKTTKDTTEEDTMEEQNELNDLKKLMETQQTTLTALQEKLDRRAELSYTNAEAGVKKIALEYKVVDLKIEHELTIGFGQRTDDQTVAEECEEIVLQKYREFEQTKLKELGEEGWTLRSIARAFSAVFPEPHKSFQYDTHTNLYYFSRPL